MTIRDVAVLLAASRATVYRLLDERALTPIRMRPHGHVRIAESEVAALIERRRAEGASK
jgi:excisionase family DNA binding protein